MFASFVLQLLYTTHVKLQIGTHTHARTCTPFFLSFILLIAAGETVKQPKLMRSLEQDSMCVVYSYVLRIHPYYETK